MQITSKVLKSTLVVLLLMTMISLPGFAREKYETIDATAYGTSTQLGRNVGVTVIIYEFSTPEDRQILVDAFQKGQNQGLVNALEKMKAVGRIQIPGTLGYDLSFIRLIQTPTGRKIRFVTNRKISFGEAYSDSQTQSFNLTAGEFGPERPGQEQKLGRFVSGVPVHNQQGWGIADRPESERVEAEQHYRLEGHR